MAPRGLPRRPTGRGRTIARALAAGVGAAVLVGLPAEPAAQADGGGCSGLSVTDLTAGADGMTVVATLPARLRAVAKMPTAFRVAQDGRDLPVKAVRLSDEDLSMVVVVAVGAGGTANQLQLAVAAGRELVLDAPPGTRLGLVDAIGTPRVLSGPTADRRTLMAALSRVRYAAPGSTRDAVALAAAQLPGQGRRHVVLLTAGGSPGPEDVPSPGGGVVLHSVAAGPTGPACPPSGQGRSLVAGTDDVLSRLAGEYQLRIHGAMPGLAVLQADLAGQTAAVLLEIPVNGSAASTRAAVPESPGHLTRPALAGVLGLVLLVGFLVIRMLGRLESPSGNTVGRASNSRLV